MVTYTSDVTQNGVYCEILCQRCDHCQKPVRSYHIIMVGIQYVSFNMFKERQSIKPNVFSCLNMLNDTIFTADVHGAAKYISNIIEE